MSKLSKTILFTLSGIAVLAILAFSVKIIADNKYRRQLPAPPDMQTMSGPLKAQISDAWNTAKHNPTARNMGRLGMVYHSSTFYDKAAQCYKLAISRNKSKWVWHYYLGYLDKELGENAGVIENFTKVVEKKPETYLAWYYIAEGYQSTGKNDKAEEIFTKLNTDEIESPAAGNSLRKDNYSLKTYARFQLASIYLSTQRIELAEKTLMELIEDQRSFGQAYRLLGSIYGMKGDPDLSKKYTSRAAELMIFTPPVDTIVDILALTSRSELYLLKQVDDAEKGGYSRFAAQLLAGALTDFPEDKFLISKAIKLYLILDLGKMAMPLFEKHLELFSSDIIEIKMVADLCMKKGLYPQALEYYSRAASLQPDDIDVRLSVVLCLGNQGAKQQALDSINLLLEKHRENLKVCTDGAYIMLMLGETEKAASILLPLRKKYAMDPKVLQLSGILLQQEGKEDEALKMFENSFRLRPDDLSTTRYLCDLFVKKGMWEKAISSYRKALEINPNDPYLQESLGSLLIFCPDEKLKNLNDGREYSERAFINKSSPPKTIISAGISLSEAYSVMGDKKNAGSIMGTTIQLAKREKAPDDLINNLQNKLEEYNN